MTQELEKTEGTVVMLTFVMLTRLSPEAVRSPQALEQLAQGDGAGA